MTTIPYAVLPVTDTALAAQLAAAARPPAGWRVALAGCELPPQLDRTFSQAAVAQTAQSLVIFGPPPEWLGRLVAPEVAAAAGMGEIGKSVSADRLLSLSEVVLALCPAASGVIQPFANHMAFPAAEFAQDAAGYLSSRNPVPLWAYPKVSRDQGAAVLESTGLAAMGLPELAIPIDPRQADVFTSTAYALMRAMVDLGPLPIGTEIAGKLGRIRVQTEMHGALWCVPLDVPLPSADVERARGRVARKRALSQLLGKHTQLHVAGGGDSSAKEYYFQAGSSLAMSNGACELPQPGGTSEARNDRVEIVVRSPKLGPWAHGWLDWAVKALQLHDETHPIRAFDRLALPAPQGNIAGVVTWPFGHLQPQDGSAKPVHLWVLIPITVEELEQFRRDPAAQGAWIREREARQDLHLFEERWVA